MDFPAKRKKTRPVWVGSVKIGDNAPISVQSMTHTKTENVTATVAQIRALEKVGCDLVRVAIPTMEAAEALSQITAQVSAPIVADIHFDARLALRAAKNGAKGLRINPGNIGSAEKIKEVVACAKDLSIPIRIGVNAGSLEKEILHVHGKPTAAAMVESALRHVEILTQLDFWDIKISVKASDIARTVAAYKMLSDQTDFPLHLGITEAGSMMPSLVKSSAGMGHLLLNGVGDTLRYSITGDPLWEVKAGFHLLRALGLRNVGPEIISCPTCGRCDIDLEEVVRRVEEATEGLKGPLAIAIMGCVVNGPGEAKEADIGIAGGKETGILFKKGEVVRKIPEAQLVDELLHEIQTMTNRSR